VLVIGRLEISEWTTRASGVRTLYDIWAENVINLSTRDYGGTQLLENWCTGAAVRDILGAISVPEQSTSYSPGCAYSASSGAYSGMQVVIRFGR
jgi:hypothetical protein